MPSWNETHKIFQENSEIPNSLITLHLWEKFGLLLGKLFSPIILTIIYMFTIMPIKLILKIFSVDLINKKKNISLKSYWIEKDKHSTDFRNQF